MDIEIDVQTNGIHSLAQALAAFEKLHNEPENIFAFKDSILRSHHALETLFKNVLFQINPALLVSDKLTVNVIMEGYARYVKGQSATVLDETTTIGLVGAIERLKTLNAITLDAKEYKAFRDAIGELNSYRNKLQHLGLSANADVVGRILGIAIPKGIDIIDSISTNPSAKLFGRFSPMMFSRQPIMAALIPIYKDAPIIVELLRTNYDRLIQEAVAFFNKREFSEQPLSLKIHDHGEVGAPPYFPEMEISGFFNYSYDFHSLMAWDLRRQGKELPYEAKIKLTKDAFEAGKTVADFGVAKGTINLEAHIVLDSSKGYFVFTDAAEKSDMLRQINVTINANLEYTAEALSNNWHYDVNKVQTANGNLTLFITAVPKGFKSKEMEVIGKFEAKLDEKNSPFRLHCFVEPDGSLRKNYSLDWTINTVGPVGFK
jgi:hypothetical protein